MVLAVVVVLLWVVALLLMVVLLLLMVVLLLLVAVLLLLVVVLGWVAVPRSRWGLPWSFRRLLRAYPPKKHGNLSMILDGMDLLPTDSGKVGTEYQAILCPAQPLPCASAVESLAPPTGQRE